MQDRADLQMIIRTESCTQATDTKKEHAILFEIRHIFNENGSEEKKKKGELRKKIINTGSRKA